MDGHCIHCDLFLLENELLVCDPCRLDAVTNKMFADIIDNSF